MGTLQQQLSLQVADLFKKVKHLLKLEIFKTIVVDHVAGQFTLTDVTQILLFSDFLEKNLLLALVDLVAGRCAIISVAGHRCSVSMALI